jgi:hypothetical protein
VDGLYDVYPKRLRPILHFQWYAFEVLDMAIMALITVISAILASETFREDILRTRAQERRLIMEEPS